MLRSLVAPCPNPDDGECIIRRNISTDSLSESLACGDAMWINVTEPTGEDIEWLEKAFNLHPAVVSDIQREDRRPTLLIYPDYMFLSLFQPVSSLNKVKGEEIHCLIGERFFVTISRSATVVEEAYARVAQNVSSWKRGVSYFLYLTIQYVVDAYYPLLDRVSNQLNDLEESVLRNGHKINQQIIYRIKQNVIELRQMLAPQREVLSNVIGEERLSRTSESRDLFRHLYERLLRVYDVIDAQRELASNVLDLMQSQTSTRLSEAVNRLTVFSMIFLPLTFLSGLFELNFVTTDPALTIPVPGRLLFIGIVLLMPLSASVMAYLFHRRGWL